MFLDLYNRCFIDQRALLNTLFSGLADLKRLLHPRAIAPFRVQQHVRHVAHKLADQQVDRHQSRDQGRAEVAAEALLGIASELLARAVTSKRTSDVTPGDPALSGLPHAATHAAR